MTVTDTPCFVSHRPTGLNVYTNHMLLPHNATLLPYSLLYFYHIVTILSSNKYHTVTALLP